MSRCRIRRQGHAVCGAVAGAPGTGESTYWPTPTRATTKHPCLPNGIPPISLGSCNGRRRFLLIRDAAGEDLESADLDASQFRRGG